MPLGIARLHHLGRELLEPRGRAAAGEMTKAGTWCRDFEARIDGVLSRRDSDRDDIGIFPGRPLQERREYYLLLIAPLNRIEAPMPVLVAPLVDARRVVAAVDACRTHVE